MAAIAAINRGNFDGKKIRFLEWGINGLIHPCLVEHNGDGNLDSFGPKAAGAETVG